MFSVLLEMVLELLFCLCTIEGLTEKYYMELQEYIHVTNKIIDSA